MDACSSELKAGYNASCKLRKHSEQRSKEILVAIALMRFITCIRCRKILMFFVCNHCNMAYDS